MHSKDWIAAKGGKFWTGKAFTGATLHQAERLRTDTLMVLRGFHPDLTAYIFHPATGWTKADFRPPPTREEAKAGFRALVAKYGVRWGKDVPRSAYEELQRYTQVLDTLDRRELARELGH